MHSLFYWTSTGTLALGCVVILYIRQWVLWNRAPYPLPPGPSGLPWIGNVVGVDSNSPWKTYTEWARTYGDIIYVRMFGKDVIIINSEKIAKDLLENRSWKYSDRPHYITTEMCGLGFSSVLLHYGDRWRLHRRFFHQTFRLDAVSRFLPLQNQKACKLLRQLLSTPEQLHDHLFEYTTSVILKSTYDYDPLSRQDEMVEIAANVLKTIVPAFRPDMAVMMAAFPLLLYLPAWFPGMSFKRQMEIARTFSKHYLVRAFQYSLQRAEDGAVTQSMVHDALQDVEGKGLSPPESWMEALKEASGTAFLAASDTSNAVLLTFFLLMVLNPEVQEKAYTQINAVVGKERLPTIEDRSSLPYVDAVLWELLRYSPVSPLSLPHAVIDEDVYDGFRIPKGAVVIANVWSMARDESRYPDPNKFIPERFLNDDGSLKPNDVEHITYGFGRRICVGRHFADTSVWGVIAKFLAVFKILKPLDENGREIPVEARFSTGAARHPLPFGYRIIPRSPELHAEELEHLIAASTA